MVMMVMLYSGNKNAGKDDNVGNDDTACNTITV